MSDVMENLLQQDADYSDSKFKSKVENIFVQIKLSMVTGKTEKIQHFVNEETYSKIVQKVKDDVNHNRIQMYDELNVADVRIENIQELDDCFKIDVVVHSKALEYYIDRSTRKYISGDTDVRTERNVNITFTKIKKAKDIGVARRCPACGANVDVNANGKCSYCGAIFNLANYDWIITSMEI